MAMYELSNDRIRDIIESSRVPEPAATAPFAMVRRVSSSYQQVQLNTSIYSKYGDDDDDGANGAGAGASAVKTNATRVSAIESLIKPANKHNVPANGGASAVATDKCGSKFFPPITTAANSNLNANNQLFWCFYIAHAGMFAYETMSNAFVCENAFKYATIDHARANASRIKSQFKRYKLSVSNFEAELIGSKFLSLHMMTGLALCYERNVIYIDNRKYFEIVATDESDPFTVIEKVKNRYCVHGGNGTSEKMREKCRAEFWKMNTIESPLKSVSHYKLAELQDIYARLDIKQTAPPSQQQQRKNMTKPELYAAIMQNI
jgi:hypothetical protein